MSATFALVSERVKSLGLPIEPLSRFKPWALALTLLGLEWQAAGFDAELGLDKHFYDQAVTAGKEVQGLETIEFQISQFDEMSMEEQDRMLASTLRELETEKAAVTTLANALSVPVCVEGIESEAVYAAVVKLGCGLGQGWYFGKPMRAEDARELLAASQRAVETPSAKAVNG